MHGVSELTPEERFRDSALGRLADSTSRYEYTEPFLLESAQDEAAFAAKAERRGLRVVRGPRYLHLCDGGDKGLAVRTLLSLYERLGAPAEGDRARGLADGRLHAPCRAPGRGPTRRRRSDSPGRRGGEFPGPCAHGSRAPRAGAMP